MNCCQNKGKLLAITSIEKSKLIIYLQHVRVSESFACSDIGLQYARKLLDCFLILEDIHIFRRLSYDIVPHLIGQKHVGFYKVVLHPLVHLSTDHVTNCLVEGMNLHKAGLVRTKKTSN